MGKRIARSVWQYDSMLEFKADGGEAVYGAGMVLIDESEYWCNGESLVLLSSNMARMKPRSDVLHSDYANLTPDLYFDPNALVSTGAGTYSNPFVTASQIVAYLNSIRVGGNANLAGKIMGFKRGATCREQLNFADIYGLDYAPFIICPYGDALARPEIRSTIISRGWSPYPADPRLWYKLASYEQELYDGGSTADITEYFRYYKKASVAALQSAGAGYACYDGTYMYIFPLNGENPNGGQIEETFEQSSVASAQSTLKINYANAVAVTGNIHVYGLSVHGSRTNVVSVNGPGAVGAITAIKNIVIDDCVAGWSGVDNANTGGSDAFMMYGLSDALRLNGGVLSNCLAHDTINNAFEVAAFDGGFIEWNQSKRVSGKSVAELWFSCSNNNIQYNIGSGLRNNPFKPGIREFADRGIWIPGYSAGSGAGSENAAKNVGNVVAFNFVKNCKGPCFELGTGEAKLYNNTFVGGDKPNGGSVVSMGTSAAAGMTADVTMTNNILMFEDYASGTGGAGHIYDANAGNILRGNNNIIAKETGTFGSAYFRGVSYASLAAWQAVVVAVTAGAQSSSFAAMPMLIDGVPLRGSRAVNSGVAIAGYAVDLNNKPLSGNHIGAFNPINSLGY